MGGPWDGGVVLGMGEWSMGWGSGPWDGGSGPWDGGVVHGMGEWSMGWGSGPWDGGVVHGMGEWSMGIQGTEKVGSGACMHGSYLIHHLLPFWRTFL